MDATAYNVESCAAQNNINYLNSNTAETQYPRDTAKWKRKSYVNCREKYRKKLYQINETVHSFAPFSVFLDINA